MISRSRSRRLARLESRAMPAGDSIVMTIQFVSPEKVVTGSLVIEIHALTGQWAAGRATRPTIGADNVT